ncbi:SPRY_PRY_C-I_1 domain-containing protein isoform X3 [Ctenopharyngodon idella]|uniref:SPRY_PRY_C-I_1 domain-containing protein isoform X3 n=2 Tax=cellular organisms TaxID=131567 RepID=UPI00222FDF2F|nr:SPRY_PRY_C-I_1 domain-containing protein isoform X3 [Ctenopharyngodon idella]
MAFAAAEDKSAECTSSDISLPHINKNKRASASFPAIRPTLSSTVPQNVVKIFKRLGKACHQQFKIPATKSIQPKDSFSLDESKNIIIDLAAELDRVLQSNILFSMTRKFKNKGTKEEQEEQQHYILQWAEDLENTQTKLDKEEKQQTCSKQLSNSEMKFNKAKKILSDWSWKLKEMKQNSVCPKGECKETLRDFHKEWKQGESSILPVMDWIIWTVLQSESSEDSVSRQWVKCKQRSKNTVGLHIPDSVWNWITKPTAVVILDPNTANPDLLVSEDGKSLRAKEYGPNNWEGFQWKRSKYDGWTCVQAKEGYNTGSHYWEVDVKKKCEWRVGVVKESAPRNGYITMNTKTGYWNLRLQLGTLMALTEPVTKLNLPTPSKIGVYLDIDEGHVSFYDAVKRKHIYTFNTDFNETENIHPMFGTVETDRPLVISS